MIEIPDPPGYRVVAYRKPKEGEWFVSACDGQPQLADSAFWGLTRLILEPVEVWRDATIDDLKRAPVKARFRDTHTAWCESLLVGFCKCERGYMWINSHGFSYWEHCQVLEQPK